MSLVEKLEARLDQDTAPWREEVRVALVLARALEFFARMVNMDTYERKKMAEDALAEAERLLG